MPSLCGLRTIASAHKGQVALGRGWLVSVRKRQWVTGKGEPREAWVVDYVDTAGKRRIACGGVLPPWPYGTQR